MPRRTRKKHNPGRNDRCFCGSGKKYKQCHLGREKQPKLGRHEANSRYAKLSQKGQCLHPDAGTTTCSRGIIRAHSIQRNGGLTHIARDGHVFNLLIHSSKLARKHQELTDEPHKVGIREASTFRGFCSVHDNELFAPIDDKPFVGDVGQILLLGYRAVCHELHSKLFARDLDEQLREFDKGQSKWYQRIYQDALSARDSGIVVSINELEEAKVFYEKAIFENSHAEISYFCAFFDRRPEVLCSGVTQAVYDFCGEKLMDLGDLNLPADWLSIALIASGDGGAAVISCPSSHKNSVKVLSTLDELNVEELPHAIVRFAFEFFENTYISPDWWDGLDDEMKVSLKKRQLTDWGGGLGGGALEHVDDCLMDDGVRVVDWQVQSVLSSLHESKLTT